VAEDLHRVPLWDPQRLEQCGHRVAQVMKPDLPQACATDQSLERAARWQLTSRVKQGG
jgi:hypothetical protein